jgi:hypothetical protein
MAYSGAPEGGHILNKDVRKCMRGRKRERELSEEKARNSDRWKTGARKT